MNDADRAIQKLELIQQLWAEIGRTKRDTPKYKALIEEIRVESAEYAALVDAAKKSQRPQK